MSSYVAHTNDISAVVHRMEKIARREGGTVKYAPEMLDVLGRPENRRIKYFYYCDNHQGITIRLYDRKLADQHPEIICEPPRVILRGKGLGEYKGDTKHELQSAWDKLERHPREVSTNDQERTDKYFMSFNTDDAATGTADVSILSTAATTNDRYSQLVELTSLPTSFFNTLENLLLDHRQVVLEGPPGAGKTFVSREFARWWTSTDSEAAEGSNWKIVQFHESYGYEDFFQGIKPVLLDDKGAVIPANDDKSSVSMMVYRHVAGIFREICESADKQPDSRFVLVIDEINRGKTSRIFGELLYLLEYREERIILSSGEEFSVPDNVFLLGTMNTADRSIALVDYALRRRFKFVSLRPFDGNDAPVLRAWLMKHSVSNADMVVRLFCRLNAKISEINEHLVVGHSYFMLPELETPGIKDFPISALRSVWDHSVLPLISEYRPNLPLVQLENEYGLDALLTEFNRDESVR